MRRFAPLLLILFSLPLAQAGCGLLGPKPRPAGPPPVEEVQLPIVLFAVIPRSEGVGGQALEQAALVPVACYGRGALEGGQRCLAFAEEGGVLKLEGGEQVVPGGRTRPHCPGGSRAVGLSLPGPVSAGFAVWPAKRLGAVIVPKGGKPWEPSTCQGWCSFRRAGHPRVRVEAGQMARLAAAARAAGLPPGAGPLEVLQAYTLDQDGDGKAERFFAVAALDQEQEDYAFAFSALFMDGARGKPLLVRREDSAAVVLRGAVDLDGDGDRELWLLLTPTAGGGVGHEVIQISQRHANPLGGYRCVPR